MAFYKRRYVARRRTAKRYVPKMRRVYKRSAPRVSPVHTFTRWVDSTQPYGLSTSNLTAVNSLLVVNTGVTEAGFGLSSCFNDIITPTDFTNLFDQYRIDSVSLYLKMVSNPNASQILNGTGTAAATNYYPTLWYCTDKDDVQFFNCNLANIKQKQRARHVVMYPNKEFRCKYTPTVLFNAYDAGGSTGQVNSKKRQWVEAAITTVPHYGFKGVFDFEGLTTPAQQWHFKLTAKYKFSMKDPQ